MEDIKLVISDLDGTLLHDDKSLDTGIVEVIRKLKQKGILFTCITGRHEDIAMPIIDKLNLEYVYGTDCGASILKDHKFIQGVFIPQEFNNLVCNYLYEHKIPFLISTDNELYYNLKTPYLNKYLKYENYILYDNHDLSKENIVNIAIDVANLHEEFEKLKLFISANTKDIDVVREEYDCYHLEAFEANKAQGVKQISEILGIDTKNIMVIGDNYNDVPMAKVAGVSVAPKNAEECMKKIVNYITEDNNSNGVSKFLIEHFDL